MSNQLTEIERFAYCYMEIPEISIITGADAGLIEDPTTDEGKAFLKGRLIRKANFNESIIKLTDQLSSPAMAIEQKMADRIYIKDLTLR